MPVLAKERTVKKIILPSSTKDDPAWVEVYEEVLSGDMIMLSDVENKGEAGMKALVSTIKDWNFTEPDGKTKAPVTLENVKLLTMNDMLAIMKAVKAFEIEKELPEVKKNS